MRHVGAVIGAGWMLLVAGCGGKAFAINGDAGDGGNGDDMRGDDGGNGDEGATCSPLPGCSSRTTCNSGCDSCSCVNGNWACSATHCFDASPPVCPTSPPMGGSYCVDNGLSCGPWGPGCGPQCTCTNSQWRCIYPPCPPPVCPSSPPSGSCSGEIGLQCSYGSGCNMESCDCVGVGGGAQWECIGSGCVDAGHVGDGGH